MFRFTIRELVLVTLGAAMGAGWWMESWRSKQQDREIHDLKIERDIWWAAFTKKVENIGQINLELKRRGRQLIWSKEGKASIGDL